jgi:hypothetical protein
MFGIQEGATVEQLEALKQALLELPNFIHLITSHELGVDLKLAGGQAHPAGKNRTIAWTATFASVADYEVYETHPTHLALINEVIKPIILPGSRAAIQYEY